MKNVLINIRDCDQSVYYPLKDYDYYDLLGGLRRECEEATVKQKHEWQVAIQVIGFVGGVITISGFVCKLIDHIKKFATDTVKMSDSVNTSSSYRCELSADSLSSKLS